MTAHPTRDSPDIPILIYELDSITCCDSPPVVNTPAEENTHVKPDDGVTPLTLAIRPRRYARSPNYLNDYDIS